MRTDLGEVESYNLPLSVFRHDPQEFYDLRVDPLETNDLLLAPLSPADAARFAFLSQRMAEIRQ